MSSPRLAQSPRIQTARSRTSRSQSLNEPRLKTANSFNANRTNKLYHCPQTPPPEAQVEREQSFILDCKAVSHISNDYSKANPKLGSVIPPYDAQTDPHAQKYFQFFGIPQILDRSEQLNEHESTAGKVYDRFYASGHGFRYLSLRNKFGSGHSIEEVRGHELFLSDPKPIVNYNGLFGYRRNNPSLRRQPTIGVTTLNRNEIDSFGQRSKVGCGRSYAFHCQCKLSDPCRCHNQDKLCSCVKA